MKKYTGLGMPVLTLFVLCLLTMYSADCTEAAKSGVKLCLDTAVPALFPFFVLAAFSVPSGLTAVIGRAAAPIMERLFHVPGQGAPALVMGLLGGYPVGAQAIRELYEANQLSKRQAEQLLCFCNNSGPAFLIGVCGGKIFHSAAAGLFLYGVHIASALLTGLLLRPLERPAACRAPAAASACAPFSQLFTQAVRSGIYSCLHISAFVIFFSIFLCILEKTRLLSLLTGLLTPFFYLIGMPDKEAGALVYGVIELTNGLALLSPGADRLSALAAASVMIAFGGLSVHFQTLNILLPSGLSARFYFLGKAVQSAFAFLLSISLAKLFPSVSAVFAPTAAPSPQLISALSFALLLLFSLMLLQIKKMWKYDAK